tara:strand:+ start:23869 stop:23970 length:102 start_codon:yes stop_codon:yes gene_type:complete
MIRLSALQKITISDGALLPAGEKTGTALWGRSQ